MGKSRSTDVLILGAGMAGLSTAFHLRKTDAVVVERSDQVGGLSRSFHQDGFTFDHTGHLLHLHNPYTQALIPELLKGNLVERSRNAAIFSHGVTTRYPFQANTYGLPPSVIKECVQGLVEAKMRASRGTGQGSRDPSPATRHPESLRSWVLRTFGKGFAKHFFFPYNEKLWTVSPDALTAEWVAPFVPQPKLEEVLTGALEDQTKRFGYNAIFHYPRIGGIQALAFAFAKRIDHSVLKNETVTRVDWKTQQAHLASGETVSYRHLVSTLPLVRLLDILDPLPAEIRALRQKMRWSSVYCLNIGVQRPHLSDKHWIYFPEKKYAFYRVGFSMNFSDAVAPKDCSSMYVEIGHAPGRLPHPQKTLRRVLQDLQAANILDSKDKIATVQLLPMPFAYVTYDKNRTRITQETLKWLSARGIQSIGRFGGWKYSYMEEAILEGRAAAQAIEGT